MPKTKHKIDYSNIKVPTTIIEGIDNLIEKNLNIFRYRSPHDFIIETARLRLEEFERKIKEEKFPKRK